MESIAIYSGLFLSTFASATFLPLQSETVLVGLLLADRAPWAVIAIASVGNVAGAVVNWLIGRGIEHLHDRKWFPVSAASLQRSQAWYLHYGKWTLLLSWMPMIGNPTTQALPQQKTSASQLFSKRRCSLSQRLVALLFASTSRKRFC